MWSINVVDKVGFSCYDIIDVREIIDMGDSYNIITTMGDMFIEKEYCNMDEIIVGENIIITKIEYTAADVEIYIERLDTLEYSMAI